MSFMMMSGVHAQTLPNKKTAVRGPAPLPSSVSILEGTKDQDGLIGPVRRVRTEIAKLSVKSGKPHEGPRQLLEITAYNLEGNRIENTYYPIAPTDNLQGKQEYKYDEKGNVIDMTLRDRNGAILNREVYAYEFDAVGNWTKMVTSLVVYENGVRYEPVEVTYRTITYYLNENMAKVKESGLPSKPIAKTKRLTDSREVAGSLVGNAAGNTPSAIKSQPPTPTARLISADDQPEIAKAVYPEEAKRAGVSGTVAVKVTLNPQGRVMDARPIRGPAILQAAAVDAAMNSRFLPAPSQTQSQRSAIITFTFSLLP
jgi:TonB family protein